MKGPTGGLYLDLLVIKVSIIGQKVLYKEQGQVKTCISMQNIYLTIQWIYTAQNN